MVGAAAALSRALHASHRKWPSLMERLLAEVTERRVRRRDNSLRVLEKAMLDYLDRLKNPKGFVWTTGWKLVEKPESRFLTVMAQTHACNYTDLQNRECE